MIFDNISNKNIKLSIADTNISENYDIQIIFNSNFVRDMIFSMIALKETQNGCKISLTKREKQVLKCLSRGKSNEEIAASLNMSVHTAKAHIHNIFDKLSVQDRTGAVVKAIKYNLINI